MAPKIIPVMRRSLRLIKLHPINKYADIQLSAFRTREREQAANPVLKATATNWALPTIANRNTNLSAHKQAVLYVIRGPYIVASHVKILNPVCTSMIIVAYVMFACLSTSIPTVNMRWAHNRNPKTHLLLWKKLFLDFRMPPLSFFRGE